MTAGGPAAPDAHLKVAFEVDHRPYTWRDVLLWADRAGALSAHRQVVMRAIATQRVLGAGAGLPSSDALDEAGLQFRTERRLTSVDEFEAWMRYFAVHVDDLVFWLQCHHASPATDEVPRLVGPESPTLREQIERHFWPFAVFSNQFLIWSEAFARRLAANAALDHQPLRAPHDAQEHYSLEQTFLRFCTEASSREVELRRSLEAHWHKLTWIQYSYTEFPTEDVASEALLCIIDGRGDLGALSRISGVPVTNKANYLGCIRADLAGPLFSAYPGEPLGPLPTRMGFSVAVIHEKRPPTFDDRKIHRKVREIVQEQAVRRAVVEHIEWKLPERSAET